MLESVRELRKKLQAASALLDEVDEGMGDADWRDPWAVGMHPRWQLRQARQRLRITEQTLAKADDPRLEKLAPLKRLRRSPRRTA